MALCYYTSELLFVIIGCMESMTGFMTAEADFGAGRVSLRVRSVNSRGLDIYIHLPDFLAALEAPLRAAVKNKFSRGSIDISVNVEKTFAPKIAVNTPALDGWLKALGSVAGALGLEARDKAFLDFLLTRPDIFFVEEPFSQINSESALFLQSDANGDGDKCAGGGDSNKCTDGSSDDKCASGSDSDKCVSAKSGKVANDASDSCGKITSNKSYDGNSVSGNSDGGDKCASGAGGIDCAASLVGAVKKALGEALDGLSKERLSEGQYLERDILEKITSLESIVSKIDDWQPKMEGAFRLFIQKKLEELKSTYLSEGALHIDDTRLSGEVALMLVRYTISEEVVRLKSHLQKLRALLASEGAIGKRIEFFTQEIGRELNTIASKSTDAQVSQFVISAKDVTEAIKEQSRNIE